MAGKLDEIQPVQRMILRQSVFECLDESRRRNGSRDKGNTHRLELRGWQGAGRQSGPETVAIAGDGRKARDATGPHKIVDLGALQIGVTVIATCNGRVAAPRPRFADAGGQVLQIGAPVEGSLRVSPQLPGCRGCLQTAEEPVLLFAPKNRLRRTVFAKVNDLLAATTNDCRRLPAGIFAPGIEDLGGFFGNELG